MRWLKMCQTVRNDYCVHRDETDRCPGNATERKALTWVHTEDLGSLSCNIPGMLTTLSCIRLHQAWWIVCLTTTDNPTCLSTCSYLEPNPKRPTQGRISLATLSWDKTLDFPQTGELSKTDQLWVICAQNGTKLWSKVTRTTSNCSSLTLSNWGGMWRSTGKTQRSSPDQGVWGNTSTLGEDQSLGQPKLGLGDWEDTYLLVVQQLKWHLKAPDDSQQVAKRESVVLIGCTLKGETFCVSGPHQCQSRYTLSRWWWAWLQQLQQLLVK